MRKTTYLPEEPSHKLPEPVFAYSEGAAKENRMRSEYQIKQNTKKGKRKRNKERKHSVGPEHSSLGYTQGQHGGTHTRRQNRE